MDEDKRKKDTIPENIESGLHVSGLVVETVEIPVQQLITPYFNGFVKVISFSLPSLLLTNRG